MARGSDIDSDLRRDDFDGYYDRLEWDVVAEPDDNDARLLIRLREIAESAHIIGQCVDLLEDWPDDTGTPAWFKIYGPSLANLQALPGIAVYKQVPDLIATLGILDTIIGKVDR